MKISEYPQVSKLAKTNIFLLDGPNGTENYQWGGISFRSDEFDLS